MPQSKNTRKRNSKTTKKSTAARKNTRSQDMELWYEVGLIVLFAFMVFLFLCNFNLVGPIGLVFKHMMFGLFGLTAYVMPVLLFVAVFFGWVNKTHPAMKRKVFAGVTLFFVIGAVCELIAGRLSSMEKYSISGIYQSCIEHLDGGGALGGSLAYGLYHLLDIWGSVLVLLAIVIICLVLITERSFVKGVQKTGRVVVDKARTNSHDMREYAKERARLREETRYEQLRLREEELQAKAEGDFGIDNARKGTASYDRNRKVTGVNFDSIFSKLAKKEDIHSATTPGTYQENPDAGQNASYTYNHQPGNASYVISSEASGNFHNTSPEKTVSYGNANTAVEQTANSICEMIPETDELHELRPKTGYHTKEHLVQNTDRRNFEGYHKAESYHRAEPYGFEESVTEYDSEQPVVQEEPIELTYSDAQAQVKLVEAASQPVRTVSETAQRAKSNVVKPAARPADKSGPDSTKSVIPAGKPYLFPPVSLLQKGKSNNVRDGQRHLEETARRLQECLKTFGVNVTITDISQGPAVTRYELQPEQGVKVSKIVNLSDDIKLNLAATDIRIEAPIPGKSAIGIEVPNKENSAVAFRELIETSEFKDFPSKIAFAVGKDIAGKVVVSDIAKMPHMLIAGSTGSGKSVCINTLIMSILYKAHPDEVKLIMIDPKVVELSSYNGIPHLLIPVVTDPKQAAGALQWGVSEMMARYEKFAELNVRDMKGYNAKLEEKAAKGEENLPKKLPQIVIIVDELADLMMVAPGEVEESICRLAQLARAAGIHLIIATQRPSVDVITGLIKANMPSRVAFAVSSGVDSRTILDMNGAEKLLGKGDMLFYPQGYSKPVRVQGSFVSDAEVGAVVDYLKNQQIGNVYQEEIQNQINSLKAGGSTDSSGSSARADDRDTLFADAGRFIIEKDKASIGMLQRVFKIGFNRAARIVDQLCEHGVVGEEEGTKPRKVLMSPEQFEALLEEI